MGCTPSIHVSQTGVVYCRDSDESNSPHGSSSQAHAHCVSKVDYGASVEAGVSGLEVRTSASATRHKPERRATISITEAETQTSISAMKGVDSEVLFGTISMKLKQHTMSIMLVFGKEDTQSDGFWWAADRGGYKCNLARNAEGALECYLDKHQDVVIIDNRHSKYFDAEALCRSIRATKSSEHTVIIAVTKKPVADKEEPSILPLLNAGFNRRFIENSNVGVCLNELLALERNEVRANVKLRAANAMAVALEHSADGVKITNEAHEIQYVNPMYERLSGYTSEEIVGRDSRELPMCSRQETQDSINTQLKKGKSWEGVYLLRRKTGESHPHQCHISPVLGQAGKSRHFVSVFKNTSQELPSVLDRLNASELSQLSNGGIHSGFPRRRDSIAKIHSMTIEAPINKVMHIITAAQENSPITVVQALDRVLEILRTTELYSPPSLATQQVNEEDQMTSDLVGGLMTTQGLRRRYSSQDSTSARTNHPHTFHNPVSTATNNVLNQLTPEISAILDKEATWDFNILELERVTNKRPLTYLGFRTLQRFGVMEYLQISESVMYNWLQMIESNYRHSNYYHNSTHAADVMHATAYFLERDKLKTIFDQMDEVAALIAAIVHDLNHPGKTNSFLINARHELAVLYNDLAVLENHHASLAFQLSSRDSRADIFKNIPRDDYRLLRQQVIDMVLATEMSKHFEHLSKFTSCVNPRGIKSNDDMSSQSGRGSPESHSSMSHLTTADNRMVIKRMMIKCSDVSNPTRSLTLCKEWARRIVNEYFQQTDEEKAQGLPVAMPVFDRKTCNFPNSQVVFIELFINDMFDAWDGGLGISPLLMERLPVTEQLMSSSSLKSVSANFFTLSNGFTPAARARRESSSCDCTTPVADSLGSPGASDMVGGFGVPKEDDFVDCSVPLLNTRASNLRTLLLSLLNSSSSLSILPSQSHCCFFVSL